MQGNVRPKAASLHQNTAKMKFSELMIADQPVLVDFYADWCGPCKAMAPVLDEVKSRMGQSAHIFKVNVDKHPDLAKQFGVMSIPTLIAFSKGQIIWKKVGMASVSEMVEVLQKKAQESKD
jgi:thioredoxin 1